MIYIDLENNPPSDDWINEAENLTNLLIAAPDQDARNLIIDNNDNLWRGLRDHLSNLSHGKCWYSESINNGAYCHVDHFRPKKRALNENGMDQGGYWWLSFDWKNYRFSAPATNIPKKDYFHVNQNKAKTYLDPLEAEDIEFLDPTDIEDPQKLAYDIEGKVTPKSLEEATRDYKRASYTITKLKLNEKFKDARRDKFRKASNLVKEIAQLLKLNNQQLDLIRNQSIKIKMKELRSLASPSSQYSAAVKFCLKYSGYDWAIDIAVAS